MGQARARAMRHRSVGLAESSALSVFPLMAAGESPSLQSRRLPTCVLLHAAVIPGKAVQATCLPVCSLAFVPRLCRVPCGPRVHSFV